jgi:hypothetical protein
MDGKRREAQGTVHHAQGTKKGRRRKEGKARRVGVEFVTIGVGCVWGYNKRRNVIGLCEEERGENGTECGRRRRETRVPTLDARGRTSPSSRRRATRFGQRQRNQALFGGGESRWRRGKSEKEKGEKTA